MFEPDDERDRSATGETDAPGVERPEPWIAVLLTLFLPGTGHVYAGRIRKGWALGLGGLAAAWTLLFLGAGNTLPGLLLLLLAGLAYMVVLMVSAARAARRPRPGGVRGGHWISVGALAACLLLGNLAFRTWMPLRSFSIPSTGMEPTLRVGDRLVADMTAWSRREPRRGDLVILTSETRPELFLLRRVVGLPGERLEIRDKQVYIDGERLDEPWVVYADSRTYPDSRFYPPQIRNRDQFGPETVPEGMLFLLGDNRDNSSDSRFHGPVDRSLLLGRPLYIYWSTDRDRIGRSLRPAEP